MAFVYRRYWYMLILYSFILVCRSQLTLGPGEQSLFLINSFVAVLGYQGSSVRSSSALW